MQTQIRLLLWSGRVFWPGSSLLVIFSIKLQKYLKIVAANDIVNVS